LINPDETANKDKWTVQTLTGSSTSDYDGNRNTNSQGDVTADTDSRVATQQQAHSAVIHVSQMVADDVKQDQLEKAQTGQKNYAALYVAIYHDRTPPPP